MIAIVLAAPFIRYALGIYYQHKGLSPEVVADAVYWNTLSHLDAFFIGGSIPVFALNKSVRKPAIGFFVLLALVMAAGVADYVVSDSPFNYLYDLGYGHGRIGHYEHVWHYTLLNLLYASFVLLMVSEHTRGKFPLLGKVLENNWLVRIGKVSYGMYVFHWAIEFYFYRRFEHLFPPQYWVKVLLFIPYLALVYGFAELSFRFYENKFILLKDRFFSDKPKNREEAIIQNTEISAP